MTARVIDAGAGHSHSTRHNKNINDGHFNNVQSRRLNTTVSYFDNSYLRPGSIAVSAADGSAVVTTVDSSTLKRLEVGDVLYPELGVSGPPRLGPEEARAWLAAERPSVLAATEHCAEHGPLPMAWRLIDAVGGYFGSHGHHVEFVHAIDAALGAARAAGDHDAETLMLVWLAAEHRNLGDPRAAQRYLRSARPSGRAEWRSRRKTGRALAKARGTAWPSTGRMRTPMAT